MVFTEIYWFLFVLCFGIGIWENWDAHNRCCRLGTWWLRHALHLTLLSTCELFVSCLMVPSAVLVRIASSLWVLLFLGYMTINKIKKKTTVFYFCCYVSTNALENVKMFWDFKKSGYGCCVWLIEWGLGRSLLVF